VPRLSLSISLIYFCRLAVAQFQLHKAQAKTKTVGLTINIYISIAIVPAAAFDHFLGRGNESGHQIIEIPKPRRTIIICDRSANRSE